MWRSSTDLEAFDSVPSRSRRNSMDWHEASLSSFEIAVGHTCLAMGEDG